ncbi:MAG: membrane protein insertase YidC [Prevotella sp.]|uniref:membrane protein insertase YidC n=1 Tax=Prevotella sp. P3-122 TaxID=2024223 RepID=UPI000B964157|nr:membrane protein insertase YidC [Prevotella sp. P3-122]MCI6181139.1 membrane protein insertase YidC [Prevotella sp.]MCI6309017.1 membrane protein insertase YidC [Prevotella sp.]MCI6500628.1 membrane protein insertase YidC [Prevotella sp.]MDY3270982.1 membrane protein insertase YidC [Prevotella sp.]MDY3897001.1 membrane protein insertase YidC [Prevotella sp.]
MDKNNIIGFVLIALVLIGFTWYQQPSAEEQRAAFVQDSIAQVTKAKAEKQAKLAEAARQKAIKQAIAEDTTSLFYNALRGQAESIVLKNEKIELTLNTKGATVEKAVIKGFDDYKGNKEITLFDGEDQKLSYTLSAKETNISTSDLYFVPSAVTDSTVTFTAEAAQGKSLTIEYRLGADYMLHMKMYAEGMQGLFAPGTQTMDVNWKDKCRQQEKGFMFENRYATLTYHNTDGGTDYLSETSAEEDEPTEEKTDWIAFKNQFFSAVMIAKDNFDKGALLTSVPQEKGSGYLKQYEAKLKAFFDPSGNKPSEFEFYYGPNDFRLLKRVEKESAFGKELEMQRLVYLGWPLFRIINRWFTIYVFDFLTGLNINMGIVLILITLLLKFITFPMVKKSYMSSAKMRVLKPKLEAATAQYNKPEDQMQKQQAMMAEYSKYGVSPLSGCLPMLIQMPIWIAMFNFVPNAIQLRGQSFLWISDLSTYDPIIEWNSNIWLIGDHLSLTCILFCVSNILYSWMTMRQQRDQMVGQQAEQMKMMQWMMYLMPLMFFFMFNDYSAGLNFYYFISLFFSAAIMWVLRKTTDDEKLLKILEAKYEENKKNPKKMTGMIARMQALQEMQRQQLEKQRQQNRR